MRHFFWQIVTCLLCGGTLIIFACAQEAKPEFWTKGGDWGPWLKIPNYPGLAIRTACGDDSTLQSYAVSSTDWQFRNGYDDFMAVIWRVETFDRDTGKSMMSGWMEEFFAPGQTSDGWTVEPGHCKARNVIKVQVKCAEKKDEESACFKDSSGNPYPLRGQSDFRGDHSPTFSESISRPLPTHSDARSRPHDSAGLPKAHTSTMGVSSASNKYVGSVWRCRPTGYDPDDYRPPDLRPYELTLLTGGNAIHAYWDQGVWVLGHSTWKTEGSQAMEQSDGWYKLNGKAYVEAPRETNANLDTVFPQTAFYLSDSAAQSTPIQPFYDGLSAWVFHYETMTDTNITGYVSIDDPTLKYERNQTEPYKHLPVSCEKFGTPDTYKEVAKAVPPPPPMQWESCAWAWKRPKGGGGGWQDSVSPVHEVEDIMHSKCMDFGRWVFKNHPDMDPQFNPDSPNFIGMSLYDGHPIDRAFATNGEAQSARTKHIQDSSQHNQVEELSWTP